MRILFLICFLFSFKIAIAQENEGNFKDNFIDLTNQSEVKSILDEKKNESLKESKLKSEKKIDKKNISPVRIGKLESPSLGSIGIKTDLNKKFGLNIWSNLTAKTAIKYLNNLPNQSSSKVYQKMLNDIYASTSEPPKGDMQEITNFVNLKLLKLSVNGHTETLLKIVDQLPDSKIWEKWKRWFVVYKLLNKEDERTCKKINKTKINYNNIFWEKANLVCLILQDNFIDANFIFDVMTSQNLLDDHFKKLIDFIINEKSIEDLKIDENVREPLNFVLLDILKYPINLKLIENLGNEYSQAILSLIYIEPEARAFLIDKVSKFKLIDRDVIIQAFQSVKEKEYTEKEILEELTNKADGVSRAQVWLFSQKIKDNATKASFLLKIFSIEDKNRNLYNSINLYLPVLVNLEKKTLSQSQLQIINHIQILKFPQEFSDDNLSQIINMNSNMTLSYDVIEKYKAWNLINYLKRSGMIMPQINWEKELYNLPKKSLLINKKWSNDNSYNEFILEKSIEDDIMNGKKISALLKIGNLIGKKDLKFINLNSFFVINKALDDIGLNELRSETKNEIFFYKFFDLRINDE